MHKMRVIIADCHELFLKGLRVLLGRQKDFECVAIASTQKDTVRLTSELNPDLLLLDICLAANKITDLISDIKSLSPETRTVVLTHSTEQNHIIDSLQAGAAGYLTKDIGEEQLIDSLRAVCSGQQVLSPIVSRIITDNGRTKEIMGDSFSLSERELEIIRLAAGGHSNKEIALELNISEHTVASHFIKIFRKLNVGTRAEAIVHCITHNLITLKANS